MNDVVATVQQVPKNLISLERNITYNLLNLCCMSNF